ncbi:MAG: hypothetical protein J7513_14735, partial [Solirubrobacteraceae bacterium]|nr:hypothetical protein [Solirubrobacteraceae bacterium]
AGGRPTPAAARGAAGRSSFNAPGHLTLVDMPTMELVALRTALDEAHAVRAERREAELQAA